MARTGIHRRAGEGVKLPTEADAGQWIKSQCTELDIWHKGFQAAIEALHAQYARRLNAGSDTGELIGYTRAIVDLERLAKEGDGG